MAKPSAAGFAKGLRTMSQRSLAIPTNPTSLTADRYIAEIRAESDRGAVILLATLVEDGLRRRLSDLMASLPQPLSDAIINGAGNAGTFAALLSLAKAGGIVSPGLSEMIDHIRLIRNAAAHIATDVSFRPGPFRDAALAMVDGETRESYENAEPTKVRDVFTLSCMHVHQIAAGYAVEENTHIAASIEQNGVVPFNKMYHHNDGALDWPDRR